MSKVNAISKLLASYLLSAIQAEDMSKFLNLMAHKASPNMIIDDKGYAAIHYCAGMENTKFSEKAMDVLLENGGDPNVQTVLERLTPLHIACMGGHSNIVLKLMKHGANINILDEDQLTPIQYAIDESHYEIIWLIKNFIFEKKIEEQKSNTLHLPKTNLKENHQQIEESYYTPNQRNYNFDATSPYYVNITHRRKKSSKSLFQTTGNESKIKTTTKELMESSHISMSANLFDLTENNLQEFTRVHNSNRTRDSLIHLWRNKVNNPSNTTMLQLHKNLDELLSEFEIDENNNSKNKSDTDSTLENVENQLFQSFHSESQAHNDGFITANNTFEPDSFIKSPSADVIIQVAESYEHKDNENGVVFYERKVYPSNINKQNLDPNSTSSSLSTSFTVPSDYGTDELRTELNTFGHIPGPITKNTKRLYLKRLIKFKSSANKMSKTSVPPNDLTQNFSIELRKTLNNEDWFVTIDKHLDLEKEMVDSIKNLPLRALREGHIKTSFVYLLIDPQISENLPGQYKFLTKSQTWEKFLSSIFYVGKGKSSRPYSHMYDAIQFYNGLLDANKKENCYINEFRNLNLSDGDKDILFIERDVLPKKQYLQVPQRTDAGIKIGKNGKQIEMTKKLDRIVNIWKSNNGVVCLHLFHNIIPTEAYTREASIIECLTLKHLTNKKGGDYYGITKTWTMKMKKLMGVGLLYRAMQAYLAQGESQLMPQDLY